jgi:hypothetical protein
MCGRLKKSSICRFQTDPLPKNTSLKPVTLTVARFDVKGRDRSACAYVLRDGSKVWQHAQVREYAWRIGPGSQVAMQRWALIEGLKHLTEPCRVAIIADPQTMDSWRMFKWWVALTNSQGSSADQLWSKLASLAACHEIHDAVIPQDRHSTDLDRCWYLAWMAARYA